MVSKEEIRALMEQAVSYEKIVRDAGGETLPPLKDKATAEKGYTKREHILITAKALVTGDREQEYGTPQVNFQRVADIWQVQFPERQWTPADVALALAGLKLARAVQSPKEDTFVDLAGYAALAAELSS